MDPEAANDEEEAPHPLIAEAIAEGVKAGVFRRAERLNRTTARVWGNLAQTHTAKAAELLALVQGDEK